MAANASRLIVLNHPFERVMDVIEMAIYKIGFSVSGIDKIGGFVTAKKGMDMWSWGFNLNLQVFRMENGVQIQARSECSLPTQIVDYGKNKKNLEKLEQELNMLLY